LARLKKWPQVSTHKTGERKMRATGGLDGKAGRRDAELGWAE